MIPYADVDRDSNVASFEIRASYIDVQFKGGEIYRYTELSVGASNLDHMMHLARSGEGLNSFINRVVRKRYDSRLR